MAISPYKTWSAGEILTAADLNASFSHITSNGQDLGWPATQAKDLDGFALTLDSDGDSQLQVLTDDVLTLTLQSAALFVWDGDAASPVNGFTWTAAATGSASQMSATGSDTNISLELAPKGTGDVHLRAGGSETDILATATGTATNIDLRLKGKGTGAAALVNEDSEGAGVTKLAANDVLLAAFGAATDIDLFIRGKGAGRLKLGDGSLAFPDADGTVGQMMVTDGAGALSFSTPGLVKITAGSVNAAATLEFTGLSADYRAYLLVFSNLLPSTDNVTFFALVSTDNGSTYKSGASDYAWAVGSDRETSDTANIGDADDTAIELWGSFGSGALEEVSGEIWIDDPMNANAHTQMRWHLSGQSEVPTYSVRVGGGQYQTAGATDAIRFAFGSGNISTMNYTLYGLRA